ncbi:AMP-binding protein [Rhodococcus erythropolis]|nr:AMP-binding protein [Rhodococcus erythropolis]
MSNVFDVIDRHAQRMPTAIALRTPEYDYTYRDLCRASLQGAEHLRDLGVRNGDRVMLAAPSVPEFVIVYFAIQAVGATIVPVNPISTDSEVAYIIGDCRPRVAVCWKDVARGVDSAARAADIPVWTLTPWHRDSAEPELRPVDRGDQDLATVLYTSGTTGRPKGVMLTTSNVLAAGEICAELSRGTVEDRIGTALPLFHVFGQSSVMMMALTLGGSLSLLPRFDSTAMLDMIVRDKLTVVSGVPTMWNAMVHTEGDWDAEGFDALRIAVSGGSPLAPPIAQAFESRFGCVLLDGYGLTESTSIATFSSLERPKSEGYTGPAAPRIEIRVIDGTGAACAVGEVGEVQVKSPTVMLGYLNQPEATSQSFTPDGWLQTGDLGQVNEFGDLRIVDRSKDLIIRGGFNVYPAEVEAALYEHPEVLEASVVGVPDGHLGERVAAVVTCRPERTVTAGVLAAWVADRLSYYKVPSYVYFVDSLPKGSTGKILKRKIVLDDLVGERVQSTQARSSNLVVAQVNSKDDR